MSNIEDSQAVYDFAVAARTKAEAEVQRLGREVAAAKQRLDEAKRVAAAAIPVDRDARTLTDGSPVTANHRELDPTTGQQRGYVVLSEAERAKGFVRPVRDAYRHAKCGAITTMSRPLAETYARDPFFYSATFCSTCRKHFPVGEDGEFTWYEMDGTEGPKVGT